MRLRPTRLLLAASIGLVPLLATTASAADSSLGATSYPNVVCSAFTVLQTQSPGGSYTAQSAGVITSWSFVVGGSAPTSLKLKVGRAVGDGTWAVVASSAATSPAPGEALVRRAARVQVSAGDVLGLYVGSNATCVSQVPTYTAVSAVNDVTGPMGPSAQTNVGIQLDVAAVVEPDADGDGYGDQSQDQCPTSAATQGPCPAPPSPPAPDTQAPETTIASVQAARAKPRRKARVTVTSTASEPATFECAVDSPVFRPCAAAAVLTLGTGRHTVAVRAIDAAGNVDRTAAVRSVKVRTRR